MDYPLSVVPEGSELSIESDIEEEVKVDPFQSTYPTWCTRYHCLQAYCCFVLSYLTTLKFCLTVGQYGFVVFVPYWFFNIFYGLASVLVEIHLGRYVIGPPSRAWDMTPVSKGILWCLFLTTCFTNIHDYICNSYLLKYLFWSFRGNLPWQDCEGIWTDSKCYVVGKKALALSKCKKNQSEQYCQNLEWETAGMQFWKYCIKYSEGITAIVWSLCSLAFVVVLSFIVNYKGIRSIEKLFPLFVYPVIVLWLLLTCVTFLVPRALYGFVELCDIDWNQLFTIEIWLIGFSDIVYYLGLGKITLSFISSHGRFDDNILLDVLIASFGSLFVCALLITPILSIITSLREEEGLSKGSDGFDSIDDIFVYMSEALTYYPYPQALWAVLTYLNWFLMSTSAQALTALAIVETIQGLLRHRANLFFWISITVSFCSFFLSSVFNFFPILFLLNIGPTTWTVLLLSTITWQHCYGLWRFNTDYYFMMGTPLPIFVKGCWIALLVFPAIVIFISLLFVRPNTPLPGMIYIYVSVPLSIYLSTVFVQLRRFRVAKRSLHEVFRANPNWGPENPNLKRSRIVFDSTTASKELLYRQELCNRPFKRPPEFAEQNIVQLM